MLHDKQLKHQLASAFVDGLFMELSEEEFMALCARTRRDPPPAGTCHSHDYCDANVVMLEAWERVPGLPTFDLQDDEQRVFWSSAWDLAIQYLAPKITLDASCHGIGEQP